MATRQSPSGGTARTLLVLIECALLLMSLLGGVQGKGIAGPVMASASYPANTSSDLHPSSPVDPWKEDLQSSLSHKVVGPPGLAAAGKPGIELLQDYGSFSLYRISGAALPTLGANVRDRIAIVDDMDEILLDAYPFNSQTDTLELPTNLRVDEPQGSTLQLIQFVGPIKAEWLETLRKEGAIPIQYVANNAYQVWADDAGRGRLASLVKTGDFLQYSEPYQPYFKLGESLRTRILEKSDPDEVVKVAIQIYDHPGEDSSQAIIQGLTVEQLSPWTPILAYQDIIVTVRARDLQTLALLPDVVWVGERFERQLFDEVQGQILASNLDGSQSGPSGPGYLAWLDSHGFSQDPADYPIVDVTDDGIGNGTVDSGDYTLYQFGDVDNPTRLAYVANCTSSSSGHGLDGHGHINTSIVGGYDATIGSPYQDGDGFNRGLGISPYGRIAGTRIFNDSGSFSLTKCGGTDTSLIKSIQDRGAQISSNSWGAGCRGLTSCYYCPITTYDDSAQAFDLGVRDADQTEAGNQELIFVFAAGNDGGCGARSIGSPGTGKNVITVGASENDRPTWTDGCGIGPTGADDAMDVISFSSRGPAPGGRVKPEVIAPGTHIQGTASTDPSYTGASVCDKYQPSGQTIFASSSGTSHSTPAVSGVASLYYYWLQHTYGITPSPALMKAYLIAHPTYLTGVGANDTLPSNSQGYGMPDLARGLDDTPRVLLNQSYLFDNSGETWTWSGSVADSGEPVRIVLAYTDQPGAIGSSSPQVNNLNLEATVGGSTYRGNVFSGQWSITGGSADANNNYEAIFLPPGTSGNVDITVTAFNIAGDGVPNTGDDTDQDFALVCYNCTNIPDFTVDVAPASQNACIPNDAAFNVAIGQIAGFSNPVALSASGQPAGTTAAFSVDPVNPPGSSVLTVGNTGAATAGAYSIEVIGTSGSLTHQEPVVLNLYQAAPDAVTLATPLDGSTSQPTTPTFTWGAASGAASYEIDIAADPDFNTVIDSASSLATPAYTPGTPLGPDSVYYWRVRAVNPCGNGTYSPIWALATAGSGVNCINIYGVEGFESSSGGWTHSGTGDTWNREGTQTHTGSYAFFGDDVGTVTDQRLMTPSATLPAGASQTRLYFWHWYNMETSTSVGYDGGILEISTDGGTSWTQVPDSRLVTTPYDLTISSGYSNPIGGLPAWTGLQTTWRESEVDLDSYAGNTVLFRFRLATDSSVSDVGWAIDDVRVESCTAAATSADYSDLPSSYGVAWHTGSGALRLGATWDTDSTFVQGSDDSHSDDGVTLDPQTGWAPGRSVTLYATVGGGSGYLAGWFDWNEDGDFEDAQEEAIAQNVSAGTAIPISFVIPSDAGYTSGREVQARFRLYSSEPGILSGEIPWGPADGGEVEDYEWLPPVPTAVRLIRFAAAPEGQGIRIEWETASDLDMLGFNVLRSRASDGSYDRVNDILIPPEMPGSPTGATYAWQDEDVEPAGTYYYELEMVDVYGGATIQGPVWATAMEELPKRRFYLPLVVKP